MGIAMEEVVVKVMVTAMEEVNMIIAIPIFSMVIHIYHNLLQWKMMMPIPKTTKFENQKK